MGIVDRALVLIVSGRHWWGGVKGHSFCLLSFSLDNFDKVSLIMVLEVAIITFKNLV